MLRFTSLAAALLLCAGAIPLFGQNDPALPGNQATIPFLQYPNTDVGVVLDRYEQLTGKRTIRDQTVQGVLYIVVNTPLTQEEAIRIIEISLLMNGFSLVPTADGKIVKVFGIGKNPRQGAVPIYSDAELLPDTEQIVTYVFKLQFADPVELAQTLQGYLVPAQQGYTSVVPLPKAGALLVTENTAIIRGLLRIVREIDVPPAEVVAEFITLERADAKDVFDKLTEIFQPREGGAATPTITPAARAVARPITTTPDGVPIPGGAVAEVVSQNSIEIRAASPTEDAIIVGKIKLTADTRTNRIFVVTRPINMPFVRRLIKEFDLDVRFGEPSVRQLKHVSASDVLDAVVKAITDPGAKAEGDASSAAARPGQTAGQTGGRAGQGLFDGGRGGATGDRFGGGAGGGGGFSLSSSLETQERTTIPQTIVVGNTKIIADNRLNQIIVLGNEEVKSKIFRTLALLDIRQPQVVIYTTIGELNLRDGEQFGVDYILRRGGRFAPATVTPGTGTPGTGNGNGGGDGTGTGAAAASNVVGFNTSNQPVLNFQNLLTQTAITQIAAAGSGGLSGFFTAGNSFDAIVTALESTNRFRVTSRPSIIATNNKKALIASGEEIAVPANIQSSVNSFNQSSGIVTNSSIQYKTVALKLEIMPLINPDGEVTLDIVQNVDERSGETVIDNNRIPTIATRALQTTVTVSNGDTLVLGGLIKQTNNRSTTGIPYLSKIPLLGNLFRSTTRDRSRTELVILLRPEVIFSPEESAKARERAQEFFNMESDIEGTVYPPGLRRKVPAPLMLRETSIRIREEERLPLLPK